MSKKPARGYQVWLVAILKGGARKSTTTMMLAFALAECGFEVLVVDADAKTQGVTDWTSRVYARDPEVDFPFHVHQWTQSMGLLVPFIQAKQRETKASFVLVDVGGEAPEVLSQGAILADLIVSPLGPEQGEISRVEPTRSLLPREKRKDHWLLLTRVPAEGKGAAKGAREQLVEDGFRVLETEIPQDRDTYAHVWGSVPPTPGNYTKAANELMGKTA
jgi:cellulose biosynthesis protein BcsQ